MQGNPQQTLNSKLTTKLKQIRDAKLLPTGWSVTIATELNKLERKKKIKAGDVVQVMQGRSNNLEIITAIIAYAKNNEIKFLIREADKLLKKAQASISVILLILLFSIPARSQASFNKTKFKTTPEFLPLVKQYAYHCKSISLGDHNWNGKNMLIRITEVEELFGYKGKDIAKRQMVQLRKFYRPFQQNAEIYQLKGGITRMMAVSFFVPWEGEYFIEILDPKSPGLLRYDTKNQEVSIYHSCNFSKPSPLPKGKRTAAKPLNPQIIIDAHLETFGNSMTNFTIYAQVGNYCGGFTRGAFPLEFDVSQTGECTIIFKNDTITQRIDFIFQNGQPVSWRKYAVTKN